MTTIAGTQIVPREPASLPELRAADQGVAQSLESVLAGNTRRTYNTQWRIFTGWCDEVGPHILCRPSPSPWPATWPPGRTPAPASPPSGWPPQPSRRPMSGPSWKRPAGTRACAPL